jgi:hypothetical protein
MDQHAHCENIKVTHVGCNADESHHTTALLLSTSATAVDLLMEGFSHIRRELEGDKLSLTMIS